VPIEAELFDAEEAAQALHYTEWGLQREPVACAGGAGGADGAGVEGGEGDEAGDGGDGGDGGGGGSGAGEQCGERVWTRLVGR
jgi:hypothetical protein